MGSLWKKNDSWKKNAKTRKHACKEKKHTIAIFIQMHFGFISKSIFLDLKVQFWNVPLKTIFTITRKSTKLAAKWLFSCMCKYVLLDMSLKLHNFGTEWTCPWTISKSDWIILKEEWFSNEKVSLFLNIYWYLFIMSYSSEILDIANIQIIMVICMLISYMTLKEIIPISCKVT